MHSMCAVHSHPVGGPGNNFNNHSVVCMSHAHIDFNSYFHADIDNPLMHATYMPDIDGHDGVCVQSVQLVAHCLQ
jgi:hypothetical protein